MAFVDRKDHAWTSCLQLSTVVSLVPPIQPTSATDAPLTHIVSSLSSGTPAQPPSSIDDGKLKARESRDRAEMEKRDNRGGGKA